MYNQENIDELISKFLSGNASPEEAMQLEDWKSENAENFQRYLSSEKLFRVSDKTSFSDTLNSSLAWRKINEHIRTDPRILPITKRQNLYLQIAASITFIFILGGLVTYFMNPNPSRELSYTTKSESLDLELNDGSDVRLAENSRVLIDQSFGKTNRTVRLKGKAKFNVTHQEEIPFIVEAGEVFIKDIGTIFSVNSFEGDSVFIKVDEGLVLVFDNFGTEQELEAGESAVYLRSKKQLLIEHPVSKTSNTFSFKEAPLAEVILQLNETYATTVLLENPELGRCTITTTFNNEDLETILSIITETLGLSFEKTKNGYLIKGQKCQS